jgi:putative transposase
MKPSRFTEERIIGILREREAGAATTAKRLKALEDENTKLKKLLADAMLSNAMLKEVASKKW